MTCRARSRPWTGWSWGRSRSHANGVALWTCRGDHFTFLLTETTQTASHYLRFCGQHARQRRDRDRERERWIVRWCGVELPTCQPDSSSSGIIGLPQCLDYSHYLIRFESSHGRRPTGGQVQNGATARMVEVWLPVPTNCRQRVKREEASAKSCGNYIGHSARLAAWLAKWICY